jgi:hypothetical protein
MQNYSLIMFIIILIIIIISLIYNLQNKYFLDYIFETKNYFLLFLPLSHTYLYNNKNLIIGFISNLFDFIIIAVYIAPEYRYQNYIKSYFNNIKSKFILTNNNIIIKIIKNRCKNIIDIPYLHLYYII